MSLWEILNSNFGILVLGFALTTVAGAIVSFWLQRASWKRQTRIDLHKKRYEEGTQFLNELSKLIGIRFFLLQRYLWAIENAEAQKLQQVEKEYYKTVLEWNSTYWMNRNKIRLLAGEEQAIKFLKFGEDKDIGNAESLHYQFVKAHGAVAGAKKKQNRFEVAQAEVDELTFSCSVFLEQLTTQFLDKAASLQLLKVPEVVERKNPKEEILKQGESNLQLLQRP